MSRRRRHQPAVATASRAVASIAPATSVQQAAVATLDARDYAYETVVQLARSSFSAISNPRRRRLRKGDGGYHCDYRTVEELRNISRWLEYHSGSYAGALHNWSQYLVGEGPVYTPMTADVDWNRQVAALIAADLEAKEHDIRKRFTWGRWIKLLAISVVRDGSMGVVHTVNGPAQLIESERVVAVDTDRVGRVVNYQVVDMKNGWIDYSTKQPYGTAMMDFPAVVTRVSQDLGIPLLFSSLDDHDGISDLWHAEIDASTEASRPYVIISHKDSNGLPGGQTIPQAMAQGANTAPAQAPSARGALPAGWVRGQNGSAMGLPPGLEAVMNHPERPNLDVPEFSKSVMRMACMMLLPYEFLFGDQADVSYSNGRSIRKLGNGLLNCFRTDYLNPTLKRIVHARIRFHIAHGNIGLPKNETSKDAWKKGKFEWPEIPEHDRIKERQADTVDLANGTTSLKKLIGEDWQETLEERAAEYAKAAELVAAHNKKHPHQPITIHALVGDPSHTAQLIVSMNGGQNQQEKPARKDGEVEQAPAGTKSEAALSLA